MDSNELFVLLKSSPVVANWPEGALEKLSKQLEAGESILVQEGQKISREIHLLLIDFKKEDQSRASQNSILRRLNTNQCTAYLAVAQAYLEKEFGEDFAAEALSFGGESVQRLNPTPSFPGLTSQYRQFGYVYYMILEPNLDS